MISKDGIHPEDRKPLIQQVKNGYTLALKLIVESEMDPAKDPRFQLPADSKYFRDVPKMISTEDK